MDRYRYCTHRIRVSIALGMTAFAVAAESQVTGSSASSTKVEFDDLRTPSSPAFALLGVAPTAIARPATPRAFAAELLSQAKNGSVVPENYAMEVAPYWLSPRPKLTYDEYTRPSAAQSVRQSFSLSLATARADSASDSASTLIGVGVRMLPLAGRPSAKFLSLERSIDSIQRTRTPTIRVQGDAIDTAATAVAELAIVQSAIEAARAATPRDSVLIERLTKQHAQVKERLDTAQAVAIRAEATLAAQSDTLKALANAMGSTNSERVGWFGELAAAVAFAYPSTTFEGGKVSRYAAWGTASYRLESPHVDLIGLLRLQRDVREDNQNALDMGGRLLWMHEELGVSAEWVNRVAFDVGPAQPGNQGGQRTVTFTSSNRLVGVVDYRVSDGLYVTMTFGQDHTALGEERRPLVAAFGLNLQHGKKPVVTAPTP